ncbi:MAG: SpoIIE family protein phosphatase [Deltaproteobacteria bacterium]|nr:SpoIIE family protein phosphatase [Myxococcales bacterium]MDP3216570.1 SpoIIE family protein phosphatase [Deltaproteobacteria bacterium]
MTDPGAAPTTPMTAYEDAIRGLALRDDLTWEEALRRALATDARTLGVARVSFWSLHHAPEHIHCECLFVRDADAFERGLRLEGAAYPAYFEAMKTGVVIAAHDAHADPRTREFSDGYLRPTGIGAMLDAPVFVRGALAGVVCHEHVGDARRWSFEEQQFAFSVGQVLSLALETRDRRNAEAATEVANRDLRAAMREIQERDARLLEDEEAARELQQALLPALPRVSSVRSGVHYRPLDRVSGDIYDLAVLADGRLRLFVADATGHGVAAGLTTMFLRSEYEVAKRSHASATEVLAALNARITGSYGSTRMRFTALVADLDPATGALSYATAAHAAPLVVLDGRVVELPSGGTFVGLVPAATFALHRVTLAPGDALFAFTDGLSEASDAAGASFGEAAGGLGAACVAALAHDDPAASVAAALDAFVGAAPLYDDVTVVALRWLP